MLDKIPGSNTAEQQLEGPNDAREESFSFPWLSVGAPLGHKFSSHYLPPASMTLKGSCLFHCVLHKQTGFGLGIESFADEATPDKLKWRQRATAEPIWKH